MASPQLGLFGALSPGPDQKRAPQERPHLRRQVAPTPGERGYRPPLAPVPSAYDDEATAHLADRLLYMADALDNDPDALAILQAPEWETDDHEEECGWGRADLPDLMGVPTHNVRGQRMELVWRLSVADTVLRMARESRAPGFRARWLARAILQDALEAGAEQADPRRSHTKLRLVDVTKAEAAEFIRRHHSALPYLNPNGLMYALGVMRGTRLVAVATAGTPTGRWAHPHNVLELTRVASDGTTRGAASKLVGRLLDVLEQSKRGDPEDPALFVTYQLSYEEGATYKGLRDKGLRPVAYLKGKRPGGARAGSTDALAEVDKIRWEAGPAAGAADWSLLSGGDTRRQRVSPESHSEPLRWDAGVGEKAAVAPQTPAKGYAPT